MIVEDRVIGLVEMESDEPSAYDAGDVELLQLAAGPIGLSIRNAQLFAQTQQRAQELTLLNQLSTAVNQPLALDEVLTNTLQELARVLNADHGIVAIFVDSREYLTVTAEYNPGGSLSVRGTVIPVRDNSILELILRERHALAIGDFQNDLRIGKGTSVPHALGSRSGLIVPLILRDEIIGAIGLGSQQQQRVFADAEVVLAQTIANQAASAIEKARLLEETRRHADQLAVLNRIASAINRAPNLDELLEVIYIEITAALSVDAFFIALYDERTDELNYRIRVDQGARELPERKPLQQASPMTRETIQQQKAMLVRDWQSTEDRDLTCLWGTMKPPRAWLSVPMVLGESVTGVISLQSYAPDVYDEEDRQLLTTVADQVAVIIEKARLFEETQHRALEQTIVSEIVRALNASLDAYASFPVVARGLRTLTLCERVSLTLLDPTNQWATFTALDRPRPELGEGVTIPITATAAATDVLAGRVHVTPDLATELDLSADRELYQAGYRSRINLPLMVGERVIGSLNLDSDRTDGFAPGQLPILQQIATAIAVAIENMRLFEAEQTRRAELASLYGLSRALADATNFDLILNLVVHHSVETLKLTFARVALVENDDFVVRAAFPIRVLDHELPVGHRESIAARPWCHRALEQGAALLLQSDDPNISADERADLFLDITQTLCLVPLRAGDRALGLLMLGQTQSQERAPFTPDKVRLAHSIGDQTASALRRAELFAELERSSLQAVLSLANAVDARDAYTGGHAERLAQYALAMGRALGMGTHDLEDLRYGALLHDIGKIGVPDAILLKPAPLDPTEWESMRRHPEMGEQIIRPIPRLGGAARIVRHHHERFNGSGYPDGLTRDAIPLGARVLAIADAYSAMTDLRVYKAPRSPQEAKEELKRCAGEQFDPHIVDTFLKILEL